MPSDPHEPTGTPSSGAPAHERPTRVRWLVFGLACAVSWLLYLHRYAWGVVKPAFRAEHPDLSPTELGWLDSAFNAAYALGQVPGGVAGDLYGARSILGVIVFLWSFLAAGVVWTGSLWRLLGLRALFGVAQAGAYPILSKVTRNWFPLAIRTSLQGIMTAFGRIGAACCPVIVASLLMGVCGLTWRAALGVLIVPGVILALAFWLLVRNSPREHPWTNQAERDLIEHGQPPPAPAGARGVLLLTPASLINLGMMLVYAFASTFQDQLYVYWIPLFLVEAHHMDQQEMGLLAPLPLIGGAVGGILGGFLNDLLIRRWGNRRWARSSIAFTGKFVAGILVVLAVQADNGFVAMMILLSARVFGDWSLPTQWGTITDMSGRASATVFGLVNAVGAAGGFAAGPLLGYWRQTHGWEGLFYGVAGMCLLAAATWFVIDCTKRLVKD